MTYACTFIDKHVCTDDYNHGAGGTVTCVMADRVNLVAETLRELFDKISDRYGLQTIDDLFIPADSGSPSYVGWNRLETDDGGEPTQADLLEWAEHRKTLFLADWSFSIEYRETRCVKVTELEAEGFSTH